MSNNLQTFTKGLIKENPILVLLLGCCPTLATTTSAINGMSMGLATTFVLVLSNIFISLLKGFILSARLHPHCQLPSSQARTQSSGRHRAGRQDRASSTTCGSEN